MKIVFLAPSNVAGGAERVLTSLANMLSENGEDVTFVTFDTNSSFYELKETVHSYHLGIDVTQKDTLEKYMKFFNYYIRLQKILKNIKPDVVVSFLFVTNVVGIVCCRRLGIPIIISERNDPSEYPTGRKREMKLFYPKANGFVFQSDVVKDYYEQQYGITGGIIIPNPLNKEQVGSYQAHKKKTIISVGRLIPQKNFQLLIDAFCELQDELIDYSLTIYGEGPLRDELEKQILKLGMKNKVFLPGVEREAIKKHNDAGLFIMPSNYEGYPNVLAEAMANGMICIAADVKSGTVRQMIHHGRNGYIFPVNDREKLKMCIRQAIAQNNKKDVVGIIAKNIYDTISLDQIAERWVSYLRDVGKNI